MSFFKELLKAEGKTPQLDSEVLQAAEAELLEDDPTTTTNSPGDASTSESDTAESKETSKSASEGDAGDEGSTATPTIAADGDSTTAASVKADSTSETTIQYAESTTSSLPDLYKRKRWTKEESADLFMYGPKEDLEVVPRFEERPYYTGVTFRSNRAQAVRQAHIAKLAQDKLEFELQEAVNDKKGPELPTQRAKRKAIEKLHKKLMEQELLNATISTAIPEGASELAESTTILPSAEEVTDTQPADSTAATTKPPVIGEETVDTAKTTTSLRPCTYHPDSEVVEGEDQLTTTDPDKVNKTKSPIDSTSSSYTSSESTLSGGDIVTRDIPKAIYTDPRISVRETTCSKFRYLFNRRPNGVNVYFKYIPETKPKKEKKKKRKGHGPKPKPTPSYKPKISKPPFVIAGPPSRCYFFV